MVRSFVFLPECVSLCAGCLWRLFQLVCIAYVPFLVLLTSDMQLVNDMAQSDFLENESCD